MGEECGSKIMERKMETKDMNKMREPQIEKMVLHCGGTEDKLEKSIKLLDMITKGAGIENKIYIVRSHKRIPAFGISPGKKSGAKITIRDKEKIKQLVDRFLVAVNNRIKRKQITANQACFGVHEYIEVPGLEYNRDIGILGFEIMLIFKRKGKSVAQKKIKQGKYPKRQEVTPQEIEEYLTKNFKLEVVEK